MQHFLTRSLISLIVMMLLWAPQTDAQMLQSDDCDDYPNWEWAQSDYDWNADIREGLDPERTGIACDHLPRRGIVPACWTDEIPDDVDEAMLYSIVDGDTLKVVVNGKEERVRLYRADTPELEACGGHEATDFLRNVLALNDEGLTTIWLEPTRLPRTGMTDVVPISGSLSTIDPTCSMKCYFVLDGLETWTMATGCITPSYR